MLSKTQRIHDINKLFDESHLPIHLVDDDGVKAIILRCKSYCFLRQKGWILRLFCTKNVGI